MRTISVRQWMLVGVTIFVLAAALFYHAADLLGQRFTIPSPAEAQRRAAALDAAQGDLTAGIASWDDPQWRRTTTLTLQQLGVGAVIRSPSGQELLRTGPFTRAGTPDREIAVVQEGQPAATIDLYQAPAHGFIPIVGVIAALAVAFLFVRFQMGRYVVAPLEAMERAARRIAGGDLDFELPPSRVTEVAQVGAAFRAMGDGLRQSLERQAELEEQRRFFIGAIAHDLRTPLFALRGYLLGLEQGLADSPEKTAGYIAVCREKADQLDRLVSDLFAYARTEYLGQALRRESLSLAEVLAHAIDAVRPGANAKGVAVSLDVRDAGSVEGDRDLLERAAGNLLDNALRHTPPGGRIEVVCEGDGGRICFTVADTGPGIAAQDLPHLLEPLYRGDASRSRRTGGAGLGLTIAARALEAHGGGLSAANRPGGGAEFSGWLPRAATAEAAEIETIATRSAP